MSIIPVQVPNSTKVSVTVTKSSSVQNAETVIEHNPLTMSDDQILEQIYTTHVHSDTKFDSDSLFTLAGNTLRRSINIVDNVVQGGQASLEQIDDKIPLASFNSPLCTLKSISSEMSCNPPSEEIAHKTTLAILNKLSNYDWDAKAVLTLAAFALEYGEFWLLAQHQPTDPLAKSVAVLKRVPLLTKPAAVQKHRQAIIEVNTLVKTVLQVIELMFELEKLTTYDIKDVPALATSIEQLPVDVYWAIITIAAIVTQIDCLITESEQKLELSHYGQKINIILSKLRKQITLCRQQIDEAEYYRKLWKIFQTPIEIVEVLNFLIYNKEAPQPLFDGATKTTGTLIALAALSQGQLVDMLRSTALLSPIAHLNQIPSQPLKLAADIFLADVVYWLGLSEFIPNGNAAAKFVGGICHTLNLNCSSLMTVFTVIRTGKIAKYDYGDQGQNMQHYGQPV